MLPSRPQRVAAVLEPYSEHPCVRGTKGGGAGATAAGRSIARDATVSDGLTMSSLEISALVEKRHDNVRRTIETLAEQGVIEFPQIEGIPTATKPTRAYLFTGERGKRDSIIVVAQLCPEFTARLVDRWQELEAKLAKPQITIPQTLPEALRLAADLAEKTSCAAARCSLPLLLQLVTVTAVLVPPGCRATPRGWPAPAGVGQCPSLWSGYGCTRETAVGLIWHLVKFILRRSASAASDGNFDGNSETEKSRTAVTEGMWRYFPVPSRHHQAFRGSPKKARNLNKCKGFGLFCFRCVPVSLPEPRPVSRPTQHTRG